MKLWVESTRLRHVLSCESFSSAARVVVSSAAVARGDKVLWPRGTNLTESNPSLIFHPVCSRSLWATQHEYRLESLQESMSECFNGADVQKLQHVKCLKTSCDGSTCDKYQNVIPWGLQFKRNLIEPELHPTWIPIFFAVHRFKWLFPQEVVETKPEQVTEVNMFLIVTSLWNVTVRWVVARRQRCKYAENCFLKDPRSPAHLCRQRCVEVLPVNIKPSWTSRAVVLQGPHWPGRPLPLKRSKSYTNTFYPESRNLLQAEWS